MGDDFSNSITPETNVFTESLKSLPDLERELRQLNTYNNHYEMAVS